MKRFTSAKNLMNLFNINPIQAVLIRQLIKGKIEVIDSEFYRNLFPKTFSWIDACYHNPFYGGSNTRVEIILECINEILEGFGVEAIRLEDTWIDSYHGDIAYTYINMGETYTPTILYDTEKDSFIVSSYGDIVESRKL